LARRRKFWSVQSWIAVGRSIFSFGASFLSSTFGAAGACAAASWIGPLSVGRALLSAGGLAEPFEVERHPAAPSAIKKVAVASARCRDIGGLSVGEPGAFRFACGYRERGGNSFLLSAPEDRPRKIGLRRPRSLHRRPGFEKLR